MSARARARDFRAYAGRGFRQAASRSCVSSHAGANALAEMYKHREQGGCGQGRPHLRGRVRGEVARGGGQAVDDLDVLTAFYDYAAEHRIHLRTTNRIESTFATVRLCTRVP